MEAEQARRPSPSARRKQRPSTPVRSGRPRSEAAAQSSSLGVVVDVSNVTSQTALQGRRLVAASLLKVVTQGREASLVYACGSRPKGAVRTWEKAWGEAGAQTVCLERDSDNKEQAVDDLLHAAALDFILSQLHVPPHRRGTLALLTGDGNPNLGRATSFAAVVDHAVRWDVPVEVWSWRRQCSMVYKHRRGVAVRYLDPHAGEVLREPPQPVPAPQGASPLPVVDVDGCSMDSSDECDGDVIVALGGCDEWYFAFDMDVHLPRDTGSWTSYCWDDEW